MQEPIQTKGLCDNCTCAVAIDAVNLVCDDCNSMFCDQLCAATDNILYTFVNFKLIKGCKTCQGDLYPNHLLLDHLFKALGYSSIGEMRVTFFKQYKESLKNPLGDPLSKKA